MFQIIGHDNHLYFSHFSTITIENIQNGIKQISSSFDYNSSYKIISQIHIEVRIIHFSSLLILCGSKKDKDNRIKIFIPTSRQIDELLHSSYGCKFRQIFIATKGYQRDSCGYGSSTPKCLDPDLTDSSVKHFIIAVHKREKYLRRQLELTL